MSRLRNNNIINRALAVMLAVLMSLTLLPAGGASYADTEYGFQPTLTEEESKDRNSMKLLEPSDISVISETDDEIVNRINGDVDGTDTVRFAATMSAGMKSFNEDFFCQKNMPVIKIYDSEGNVAAEYSEGKGLLKFLGTEEGDDTNNNGGTTTECFYVGFEKGALESGEYTLVFGKSLCGNNESKNLGKDIKFNFYLNTLPALDKLIEDVEQALESAEAGSEPGQYSEEEIEKLQNALDTARGSLSGTDAEKRAAAETLNEAYESFRASRMYTVSGISTGGIGEQQYTGDTGVATAAVTAAPDEDEYKKVRWEASDNIRIDSLTGRWTALYAGAGWIRAVSEADSSVSAKTDVQIVNRTEGDEVTITKGTPVTDQIKQCLDAQGKAADQVEALKLYMESENLITSSDIDGIRELMPGLKTLDLEDMNTESLGEGCFEGWTSLEKVVLPVSLKEIDDRLFYGCSGLKSVEIPVNAEYIGDEVFTGCNALNSTLMVDSACPPELGDKADFGPVSSIRVPDGCSEDYAAEKVWGDFAISETDPVTLTVNYTKTGGLEQAAALKLEAAGIRDDEVTEITITSPQGVELEKTTDLAYLQTHFLGATVVDLTDAAFADNNVQASVFEGRKNAKEIRLPAEVRHIGKKAFYGCLNLRTFTVPESVEYTNNSNPGLGESALAECPRLRTIIMNPAEPPGYSGSMPAGLEAIKVPALCVDEYKNAFPQYRDIISSQVSISTQSTVNIEVLQSGTLKATVDAVVPVSSSLVWEIVSPADSDNPIAVLNRNTGVIKGNRTGTAKVKVTACYGTINECSAVCEVNFVRPAAVSLKAASNTYNSNKLTWSAMSGATSYQVYRATSANGTYTLRATLKSTARSYIDTGLTTGKTYYYKVRGCKVVENTNVYNDYSAAASAAPALAKPATPAVSRASKGYVKVKWKGISGETGYQVYRATSKNGKYTKVKSVKMASAKTPYAKIKTKKGKTYYYKVRAYKKVSGKYVYSAFSNCKSYKLKK